MSSPAPSNAPPPPATDPPLRKVRSGKVRDVYELPVDSTSEPRLLMVASDRISAFDVVMPTPISGKGRVLTRLAAWWFEFIEKHRICESHLLSTSIDDLPRSVVGQFTPEVLEHLRGRVTVCRACRVIPIECVVRGYLEGSGWKEYQAEAAVCGVSLPRGLRQCDRLPEPIFTPATKEASGHDQNVTFERAAELVGLETMGVLRDLSLRTYRAAAAHALSRGIIIADTKFEFGVPVGDDERSGRSWTQPILIDEALTPDSSRFWPADDYQPGRAQRSYDKQFLREYLEGLVAAGAWDKSPPGPSLPDEVVRGTLARYEEAERKLCG